MVSLIGKTTGIAAILLMVSCDSTTQSESEAINNPAEAALVSADPCIESANASDPACLWWTGFDQRLTRYGNGVHWGAFDDYTLKSRGGLGMLLFPGERSPYEVKDYVTAHLMSSVIARSDLPEEESEAVACTLREPANHKKPAIDEFGLEVQVPDFLKDIKDAKKDFQATETWAAYTKISFATYDIETQTYAIKGVDSAYSENERVSPEGRLRHPIYTEYLARKEQSDPLQYLPSREYATIKRGSSFFIKDSDGEVRIIIKGSLGSPAIPTETQWTSGSLLETIQRDIFICARQYPEAFNDLGLTQQIKNSFGQFQAVKFDFRALILSGASDFWTNGIRLEPETARALNGRLDLQITFDNMNAGSSFDALHTTGDIKRIMGTYIDETGQRHYLLLYERQAEPNLEMRTRMRTAKSLGSGRRGAEADL